MNNLAESESPAAAEVAPLPVPDLPPRVLLDIHTDCNLKCPMCIVHGHPEDPRLKDLLHQTMGLENARKVLDELMSAKPLMMPTLWSEPLVNPQFKEHVRQIKERGLTLAMNTNGLLLNDEMARFLVEIQFDSVFFSVDAITSETLKKVRGITKLEVIHKAVERLLEARGNRPLPRIGVSFTIQPANRHEREEFVREWVPRVDAVRVGELYERGRFPGVHPDAKRTPCSALYSTMAIHSNGNVSMCCLDAYNEMNMGNVFKEGVKGVWHGKKLGSLRRLHEQGKYDKIPLCKNCDRWASFVYQEEAVDGVLIRRSAEYTYYNRIDRIQNWHSNLRGLHSVSAEKIESEATPALRGS